jgi:hypothetical protein
VTPPSLGNNPQLSKFQRKLGPIRLRRMFVLFCMMGGAMMVWVTRLTKVKRGQLVFFTRMITSLLTQSTIYSSADQNQTSKTDLVFVMMISPSLR